MKRTDPYTGPFPRKRHSHRCLKCGGNSVACYKAQCTKPQTIAQCKYCCAVTQYKATPFRPFIP